MLPPRRPELVLEVLGHEVVAYDPARGRAFHLNETAGLVLARCDGTTDQAGLVHELSRTYGIPGPQLDDQVRQVLATFVADGLVVSDALAGPHPAQLDQVLPGLDAPSSPVPRTEARPPTPAPDLDPADPGVASTGWRQALDLRVRVATDAPEVADHLDRVFGSLPVSADPGLGPGVGLAYGVVAGPRGRLDLVCDGAAVGAASTVPAALSYIQWHLNQQVIAASSRRVLVHAGAVRRPDGGLILFPGQTNAGKSTLVAGLVRAGCGYLTDELVALDPTQPPGVDAYRKAISLDPGAWPLVPESDVGGQASSGERLVDPRALHPQALAGPPAGEVALVVFPWFEAGAAPQLEPLEPAATTLELVRHTLNLPTHRGPGLAAVAELARRCPAHRLTTGQLDGAVSLVLDLAQG